MNEFTKFMAILVEAIITAGYFKLCFRNKRSLKLRILIQICVFLTLFIFFYFENVVINVAAFFIAMTGLIITGYYCSIFEALLHAGLLTITMISTEAVAAFGIGLIVKDFDVFRDEVSTYLAILFTSKLLFGGLMVLFGGLLPKLDWDNKKSRLERILYLGILIMTSGIAALFLQLLFIQEISTKSGIVFLACALLLLLENAGIVILFRKTMEREKESFLIKIENERKDRMLENMGLLEEAYKHQRELIHDFHKHLDFLKAMNPQGGIDEYIQSLLKDEAWKSVYYCKDPYFNLLLQLYRQKCEYFNIKFDVNFAIDKEKILEPDDYVSIFGNLLENSLKSAGKGDDGFIEITARQLTDEMQGFLFSITNSCFEAPVINDQAEALNLRHLQTHGIGLLSVKRSLKKYEGDYELNYNSEERTFQIVVLIKKTGQY